MLQFFHIDAFATEIFGGNPACVVPLKNWISDNILQKIAAENALPETAFFVLKNDEVDLRWFTPEFEIDLCGHGTIAAAHCLHQHLNYKKQLIKFKTKSGVLCVKITDDLYELELPIREAKPEKLPEIISQALSIQPTKVFKARDYMLVYEKEEEVRNIKIDKNILDKINLDPGGVIVTALGTNCDFVSRYFIAQSVILEDPVTGSAHCTLVPYWAELLNKKILHAEQLSSRGGKLICELKENTIAVSGFATTYATGNIFLNKD